MHQPSNFVPILCHSDGLALLVKVAVVVDVHRHLLLEQTAHVGPVNDCARLPEMLDRAQQAVPIHVVLADAEFDSERNHQHIRRQLGAKSVIPAKRGKPEWKIKGIRALMRASFPRKLYRQRVQIESVCSATKRKLSGRALGRTLLTQRLQALLLGLTFNLYRLYRHSVSPRMSTELHKLKPTPRLTSHVDQKVEPGH